MGSRNVSPESILDLAMHCPNLIYLDVSYCDQIEAAGHDVHEQLRKLLPKCKEFILSTYWTDSDGVLHDRSTYFTGNGTKIECGYRE